jgi:hypothetical protein
MPRQELMDFDYEGRGYPTAFPAHQTKRSKRPRLEMSVQLDHVLVPSKDKNAAARLLGELLGVRWEPSGEGPAPDLNQPLPAGLSEIEMFHLYQAQRASVYASDSLTIDFVDASREVPVNHYCFSVSDSEFDTILARIKQAGLKYWSAPFGEPDYKVRTPMGGKGLYFMEPDGHAFEILTVSYARPATSGTNADSSLKPR